MKTKACTFISGILFCLAVPLCSEPQEKEPSALAVNQAGIPISFHLDKESYVTLVIEDSKGDRVRNLVSETMFPAGDNTVYWNGADDHGGKNFGPHGNYELRETLVKPGEYNVRGLARDKVNLIYEFTIYNPVNPPWRTPDTKGQWLSDHRPPRCILFLPGSTPQLLIGSSIAEGAHGLVWVDLEGVKIKGKTSIVGFGGAEALARGAGTEDGSVYAGAVWQKKLVIVKLDKDGKSTPVFEQKVEPQDASQSFQGCDIGILQGMAVRNGMLVASLPGRLLIIDAEKRELLDEIKMGKSRGISFTSNGELLVLSDSKLMRYSPFDKANYKRPETPSIVIGDLDDPQDLALAPNGDIYISLRGNSHQVRVFDSKGKFVRIIGKAGVPKSGPYDRLRMNNPKGLAISGDGRLWVAEEDSRPKRVSVWTAKGDFVKAFYGPTEYGGGGKLDPVDKRRFYYQGMEFSIDWDKGASELRSVFYRPEEQRYVIGGAPETPVYIGGRQYMTNIYNSNPVGGPRVAGVWQMRDGVAVLVAAIGKANDWKALHTPEILAVIPKTDKKDQWGNNVMDITKETKYGCDNPVSFAWSDLNLNGKIDPDEVTFASGETGGLNVTPDLLFVNALTTVFAPLRFTDAGVPVYDVTKAKTLIPDCRISRGSAGDQVVLGSDGTIALSCPPSTYTGANAIYGVTSDGKRWSYPNKWPGLHASQAAPAGRVPDPGELIGVTRVLGLPIKLNGSDAGELWGLNANSGVMYLFTMDGLFVTTLFTNGWIGNHGGPQAVRGMNINDMDSGGEGFYPTITKTADGKVYLQAINHTSSIVRVDGLESVRRLPDKKIKVTAETLKDCSEMNIAREMENISKSGRKKLLVNIFDKAPVVDGKLDDWDLAEWIMLEPKTYAAMAVSQGRLYLAFRTSREKLADNAGGSPWQALFKSGGGLDLMLSPEEPSDKNKSPKAGDQRLLTSKVGEKHQSILYRPLAKGEKKPASFSSPSRTIEFEQVLDVSKDVEFAQGSDSFTEAYYNAAFGTKFQTKKGPTYELSIPLSLLDIKIEDGKNVAGDVGILIGNGTATEQRVYWSNKATTVVCDVPSEAVLTPALWGEMTFKALANDKVVFENFKSLKVGDMPSGSVAAGEIRIEPALKETGMLSISGDCPAGQSAKSLAVMGKGALHGTSLSLPFGKPEGGKGIVASFDIKGGSWNYHTQMCFADAVGKKTQVIDFGPAEKDKDKVRTLEFRQDSGKGWKTVLEIPCKYNEWERIELIWSPTKDGTGGELFLKAGDSEQNMVSIGKTDIVPDTLVLKPGYRINYTNFKISK